MAVFFIVGIFFFELLNEKRPFRPGTYYKSVIQTILKLSADPKFLGAQPGFVAALHSIEQHLKIFI
jgi:hypothetical protein